MKERAARGFFWLAVDAGGGQILSFATFMILARIVTPEDYGVFAFAGSMMSLLYLACHGIASSLVQREQLSDAHLSAAFWCAILVAAVFLVAVDVSADWIASAFGNPALAPVIEWMSPVAVLMAAVAVPLAVLRRDLNLSAFATRTLIGYIASGVVSIALALRGWGVLSLAIGQLAQWIAIAVVIYSVSPWRPRLRFSIAAATDLASFSVQSTGAFLLLFLTLKVDIFAVGAFLDARSLGYYALAQRLIEGIYRLILQPISLLVMPVLARFQAEPARFDGTYRSLVLGANFVCLPLVLGTGALAPQLVPAVFGDQWSESIILIQVMSLGAFALALNALTGQALSAYGRPGVYNALSAFQLLISAAAFGLAAQVNVLAVSLASLGVATVMLPVNIAVLRKCVRLNATMLLADGARIAFCGAVMIASMLLIKRFLRAPSDWMILIELGGGLVAYLTVLQTAAIPGYVAKMAKLAWNSVPLLNPMPERS